MKSISFLFIATLLTTALARAESLCQDTQSFVKAITCPSQELDIKGGYLTRTVKYSLPQGQAPKDGWPAVIIYQGSYFPVEFSRRESMPFGGFNEIRMIQKLLDNGFMVIAPPAINGSVWETNLFGVTFADSEDDIFLKNLLNEMNRGTFGPLNMKKLFATGISSGGYNTSRMAVSYPGVFKGLAIESASYATCGGAMCVIPDLPKNHPPTLFLHGDLDMIVPVSTMWKYNKALKDAGIATSAFVDPAVGHQWLDKAPDLVTAWFLKLAGPQ